MENIIISKFRKERFMLDLLKGKRAIITGASSGIGKGVALEYLKQGAIVGLIDIVKQTNKLGENTFFEQADVSRYDQIKRAINSLVQAMGGLDIVIANAGVNHITCPDKPKDIMALEDLSEQGFDHTAKYINNIIDINLKGAFYTIHAALFHFMKKSAGRILSTSSVLSVKPYIMEPYYACTKAGINGITAGYEKFLSNTKITINAIMPMGVDTKMMVGLDYGELVQPSDIAPFYVYFGCDDAKKENGNCINHDTFLNAFNIIKEIPDGKSKSWSELEPILTAQMGASEFKHIRDNRKLLAFLLKYK
jgi:NAD(P)-dependent dehydrogenase (short-subunit alcohol dehydrogenase family)